MIEIPDRMNAASDFVDANVEAGRGGKVAIHYVPDGSTHTYAEVLTGVNRVGNALRGLGLDLEQRVMLLLLDSPDFVYSFFGAIKIGAVPVPTNTLLTPADYEYLLNDSRARVLIVTAPLLSAIEPIRDRLHYLRHLVVAPGPNGEAPELPAAGASITVHSLAELCVAAASELDAEEMSKDDPCLWLYSSGTTGFPKGTVHLQHDMLVCANTYARQVLSMSESDITFSVAKLFFAYGLGNALYFPFRVGASTVLDPGPPGRPRSSTCCSSTAPASFTRFPPATPACWRTRTRRRARHCRACGLAFQPAKHCRRRCTSAGSSATGTRSSTASGRPRSCICSLPIDPAR